MEATEPPKLKETKAELKEIVKEFVEKHDNHQGVVFYDIFPIFRVPDATNALFSLLLQHIRDTHPRVDVVVGLEARGFVLAPTLALMLKASFVPMRKKGKLPGDVVRVQCTKEYGEDFLEVQHGAIEPDNIVILVDDLLATGGSLEAARVLVMTQRATVAEAVVVVELPSLNGRAKLMSTGVPVFSLLQF